MNCYFDRVYYGSSGSSTVKFKISGMPTPKTGDKYVIAFGISTNSNSQEDTILTLNELTSTGFGVTAGVYYYITTWYNFTS